MPLTTATGILAMLDEKDPKLKGYALKCMNRLMEEYWPEFAESEFIRKVEVFYESNNYPAEERQLAALVAAKIYYNLNSMEQALHCALGAENILDLTERSEFIRTILARCIDMYVKQRQESPEKRHGDVPGTDPRLEKLVNRLIQQCFEHRQYRQAMGKSCWLAAVLRVRIKAGIRELILSVFPQVWESKRDVLTFSREPLRNLVIREPCWVMECVLP